jgi:hypothetical protein
MRICPDCRSEVSAQAVFCDTCGLKLSPEPAVETLVETPVESPQEPSPPAPQMASSEVVSTPAPAASAACSVCGHLNIPGEMFCQNCGVQLAPVASIPPPPPALLATDIAPGDVEKPSLDTAELVPKAYFLVVISTRAEIELPSNKSELTIGRADPVRGIFPDVDLTMYGGDTGGISRLHCRMKFEGVQVYLEDLNSTNFTHVNREKLSPGRPVALKSGDEVRLGLLSMEFITRA